MSGKKGRFQSLSDAADMLKNAFARPTTQSPQAPPKTRAAPAMRPTEANPLADFEQEMMRRSEAQSQGRKAKKKKKGKAPQNAGPVKAKRKNAGSATALLRFPGAKAHLAELKREQGAKGEAANAAKEPWVDPAVERQVVFARIRKLLGTRSPSTEKRPAKVSAATAAQVSAAIARGAHDFAGSPEPDLENGFIVGFDFGTSSLKLAVRQAYTAGASIAFLTVPEELRSNDHAHLWQTALWFDPATHIFSLFPQPGMEMLEGFKTGIISGAGGQRVLQDIPVTRAEAAAAYIALQIAHFLGWYAQTRPLAAGGDRFLSINIGIPVAAHDDDKAFKTFKHIVCAARELVVFAEALSLDQVRHAHQASGPELPLGWNLIPELTAAIAGYTSEPTSLDGAHVLIDVGASTLDIVAFNHVRRERNAVFSAGVELLGSAALETVLREGISEEDFRGCCDVQFNSVYGDASRYSRGGNGFSKVLRSRDVQLITTGGGCASALHASFIDDKNCPDILGSLPIIRPLPPASSTAGVSDPSRLLLAYGLTRDIPELLELKLPSQVTSIPPLARPTTRDPSKDDV